MSTDRKTQAVFFVLVLVLYLVSLALPAFVVGDSRIMGFHCMLYSPFGVFGYPEALTNFLLLGWFAFCGAVICKGVSEQRKIASVFMVMNSMVSCSFAAVFFTRDTLPMGGVSTTPTPIESYELGCYFWLSANLLSFLASIVFAYGSLRANSRELSNES